MLRVVGLLFAGLLSGGCQGPDLQVGGDGTRFVDGRREDRTELPFRYYGTTVVDTIGKDGENGRFDETRLPARASVEIAPPAPVWLFPFDLPMELLGRTFGGAEQVTVRVETAPNPDPIVDGFLPTGLDALRERALAARQQR